MELAMLELESFRMKWQFVSEPEVLTDYNPP